MSLVNSFIQLNRYIFYDTFETDRWTDNGTSIAVDTANSNLSFTYTTETDGSRVDVNSVGAAALSDTAWVIRFKMVLTTRTGTTGNKFMYFGMCDNTVFDKTTSQDWLGAWLQTNGAGNLKWYNDIGNGVVIASTSGTIFTASPAAGTTYYIEQARLSATSYKMSIFSNSDFRTLTEAKTTTPSSGDVGLRYYKLQIYNAVGGDESWNGTIDEIYVKNGVTVW